MPIDLFRLQSATERAKRYAEEAVRHAHEYLNDTRLAMRIAERKCPWCFYFRGSMMSGQAFTDWKCQHCGKEDTWGDTGHPTLCTDCSDRLHVCVGCCADLDLQMRRKLERGIDMRVEEHGPYSALEPAAKPDPNDESMFEVEP